MNNADFLKLNNSEDKIKEIISRVKETLSNGENITSAFYFFDTSGKLYVIDIKETFLLKDENKAILRALIKQKVKDIGVSVDQILFLREGYYSKHHPNKNEMNLETDFNASNSNESLIVSVEDSFDYKLKIYDLIKINDEGETFVVMSQDPIDEVDVCKVDPDTNLRTTFINLI
jgi:hypothetical protein